MIKTVHHMYLVLFAVLHLIETNEKMLYENGACNVLTSFVSSLHHMK